MITHFITLEVDLQDSIAATHCSIATVLVQQGEPLRWAITAVDRDRQKVTVEAVITRAITV